VNYSGVLGGLVARPLESCVVGASSRQTLSAVIVSYRTPAEVAAAVTSLRAQTRPPDEIVIVDNAAPDGAPLPELPELEGARVERPSSNLGYGAGCNLGVRITSGDDVLILNADVVLTEDATAALAERLHGDDRVAVVGPRIFSHGEVQLSARGFPSLRTGLLGRRSLLTRLLVRARRYPAEFRQVAIGGGPVDWVSGACMLSRRVAFDSVGGFDEGYWMYWEDADLCRRLVDHGWEIHFEPAAVVHHATGASGTSPRTIRAFHESAARFATRHIARTPLERSVIGAVLETRTKLVLWMFERSGTTATDDGPTRVLRVIARLNVGGPAIQAITLSRLLRERGYETRLVRGREGAREGSMDSLADELGVAPVELPTLKRNIGIGDLASLVFLVRQIRNWQPQVLHTHAAKAGALGRIAALLALRRRPPVIIHTFHGHVLTGYFHPLVSAAFAAIERVLARYTTCLIAVSEEVRTDLIRLRVAPPEQIVVLPLGFDFSRFDAAAEERRARREAFRRELEIPPDAKVVTIVARLEPIKRVDRFLRVADQVKSPANTQFLVVGDGALREELQESPEATRLGNRLVWAGLRTDMPDVYFGSDVLAVTSDNEGTNVSAIEAQAAGLPVVSTRVGGMASVVAADTGVLVARGDEEAFARAVERVLLDDELRRDLAASRAAQARSEFSLERLVDGIDSLYQRLLTARLSEAGVSGTQSLVEHPIGETLSPSSRSSSRLR
jgi:GT2 family glycosyltransferase/glycosyltransferase involved in cell wall biosynthesis